MVDHRAPWAAEIRDRLGAEQVRKEVVAAAGFVLEDESDLLSHPEDDRKRRVFDETSRGRADRFVYRFRKPAG